MIQLIVVFFTIFRRWWIYNHYVFWFNYRLNIITARTMLTTWRQSLIDSRLPIHICIGPFLLWGCWNLSWLYLLLVRLLIWRLEEVNISLLTTPSILIRTLLKNVNINKTKLLRNILRNCVRYHLFTNNSQMSRYDVTAGLLRLRSTLRWHI